MTKLESTWRKLVGDKKYREEFAIAMLKRMVPFQIKAIRKKRRKTQAELAELAGIEQGVISRAENPDYGNLTLNTIGRIAAGFDMAFIGRFVPFSQLVRFSENLSEAEFANIMNCIEEDAALQRGESLEAAEPSSKAGEVRQFLEPLKGSIGNTGDVSIAASCGQAGAEENKTSKPFFATRQQLAPDPRKLGLVRTA